MIGNRTMMTEFLVRLSGFDFAAVALFVSVMALTLCAACFAAFFFGTAASHFPRTRSRSPIFASVFKTKRSDGSLNYDRTALI